MVHSSGVTTTHSLHCPQNVFNVYVNTAVAVILLPTSSLSLSQILLPLGKEKKMVFKSPSTKTNWVTKVKIALETTGLNQACLSQGLGNHNVSTFKLKVIDVASNCGLRTADVVNSTGPINVLSCQSCISVM